MDRRIEKLKSTTFGGKRFTRKQIATIQETVNTFSTLSRRELAHTICEHLRWYTPKGKNKIQSCLRALDSLEELGIVSLPEKLVSQKRGPQKKITWTAQTEEQPLIGDDLEQLSPICLQVVTEKDAISQWNEYADRHHYLGYKRPIGPHLRYFIRDKQGRPLGCLMFAYAVKSLPSRDKWIGWQDTSHKKHLDLVVNNNRFLILPWVKVKCLASKALSMASRQLADDWERACQPLYSGVENRRGKKGSLSNVSKRFAYCDLPYFLLGQFIIIHRQVFIINNIKLSLPTAIRNEVLAEISLARCDAIG